MKLTLNIPQCTLEDTEITLLENDGLIRTKTLCQEHLLPKKDANQAVLLVALAKILKDLAAAYEAPICATYLVPYISGKGEDAVEHRALLKVVNPETVAALSAASHIIAQAMTDPGRFVKDIQDFMDSKESEKKE